jgi:DNA-binding LacI/PurR family transcriptional regulator
VGRRCVQGLLAQIRNERGGPGTELVPTTLVARASTAPPRS